MKILRHILLELEPKIDVEGAFPNIVVLLSLHLLLLVRYENGIDGFRACSCCFTLLISSSEGADFPFLALASYNVQCTGSLFLLSCLYVLNLTNVTFMTGSGLIFSPRGICHCCGRHVHVLSIGISFTEVSDQWLNKYNREKIWLQTAPSLKRKQLYSKPFCWLFMTTVICSLFCLVCT